MPSILRRIATANFVLLGVLLLDRPLEELSGLPEESLALLIRTVARYLSAAVALLKAPARVWLWISTPVLVVLLVLQGVGKLSGEGREAARPGARGGDGFWINVLIVSAWLLAFLLGVGWQWF